MTKPCVLIAHLDNLPTVLTATALIEWPETPIIVIDAHKSPGKLPYPSLEDHVQEGQSLSPFIEPRLKSGEAKTKIAFLCFSSGTTGKPKVSALNLNVRLLIDCLTGCHHLICNVIQVATFNRINEPYAPVKIDIIDLVMDVQEVRFVLLCTVVCFSSQYLQSYLYIPD